MNDQVREDILTVIKRALEIILSGEEIGMSLKELSNHTIHNASIFQDEDSLRFAVVMYSLAKICPEEKSRKTIISLLHDAKDALIARNSVGYRAAIKKLIELIDAIDSKAQYSADKIMEQAGIKKGTKLYDHGISIAQSSDLFGVSQWDVYNYVGKVMTNERDAHWRLPVEERLKVARILFGVRK